MADTQGFEVVIEASEDVLRKALRGAWKSAECPDEPGDEGRIPEYLDIEGPIDVGGYEIEDGQVQIPQDELDATFAPAVNGAELKLGLNVQLQVADPPVPSAELIQFTADVRALVPIGTLPGTQDVGLLLDGLPRGDVSADLTSGHPLDAILDDLLSDFIHVAYENGGETPPVDPFIPHVITENDVVFGVFGFTIAEMDIHTELFDDETDPPHRINVSRPTPATILISIPLYLRMFEITSSLVTLADPMGIETRLNISAPFESPPGVYRARLSVATVTVDPIQPAGADVAGSSLEGVNYTSNKAAIASLPTSPDLDALISAELQSRGEDLAHEMGDFEIEVPTEAEIEEAIADIFHEELESREYIGIWTPTATDEEFEVDDVTVEVISDALIIALNSGAGADAAAITNFIPADREFAIGLDAAVVNEQIDEAIAENGFDDFPVRFTEDGKDVDLNSLNVFLVNGAIRMEGNVTVIDAILGSIDVDADFRVDVGLHWEPNAALNADGVQELKHHTIGEADVDPEESVLFWVIAIILAVISLGTGSILIAIIIIVAALVVQAIASNIGSEMLVDGVTGAIEGIQAWPSDLARIGQVEAVFHDNPGPNPDGVLIDTTGLVLEGTMNVVSSCETTAVVAAHSGGTYTVNAASAVLLAAANTHGSAAYNWLAGDGSAQVNAQTKLHTYVASGLYLAKHGLTITQPGGAASRHFALVHVRNVPPVVDVGPDITVEEGEIVTLVGHFTDVEFPDTHESMWNFGDHQAPEPGVISETNDPPQAVGTSTVQHAWCDNGDYTVMLRVRDQNGGVGTDTLRVTVLNVPPVVEAGRDLYAYPCTVLTVTGHFTDAGWCDTHTGTWNFGDCTADLPAIVHETNDPPAAEGVVIASHVYDQCGTYHAVCTVVDDDGGVGSDFTVIRVVDVMNAGFELGFRRLELGRVANHWYPYAAPVEGTSGASIASGAGGASSSLGSADVESVTFAASAAAGSSLPEIFSCEPCIVHGGQRAQCVLLPVAARAGIYQSVGANPGWEYQISVWYTIAAGRPGYARLGVDPSGSTDAGSAAVAWTEGSPSRDWEQLTQRVTATGEAISIFLEAVTEDRQGAAVGFDDVVLIPVQPFCPEKEEAPADVCVDFTGMQPGTELPPVYDREGFVFTALDKLALRIVDFGPPPAQSKLELRRGIFIDLPFAASRVRLRIGVNSSSPVEAVAVDAAGNVGMRVSTPPQEANELHTVELGGEEIVRVQIFSRSGEDTLFEVCARPSADRRSRPATNNDPVGRRSTPTVTRRPADQ